MHRHTNDTPWTCHLLRKLSMTMDKGFADVWEVFTIIKKGV